MASSCCQPSRTYLTHHARGRAQRGRLQPVCTSSASSGGSLPHDGQGHRQRDTAHKRPNAYGVFQLDADVPCTNLYDVRDACEACASARGARQRKECFEVFGLDAAKVDRYYEKVEAMERLIDQGDSMGQGLVTSGGAMMLYYLAYCILRV